MRVNYCIGYGWKVIFEPKLLSLIIAGAYITRGTTAVFAPRILHVPMQRRGYYYGDRRNSVCRSCSYVSGGRNNSLLAMFTVTGSMVQN